MAEHVTTSGHPEHCGNDAPYDDEMRCTVCRRDRRPHFMNKDSPGPELPGAVEDALHYDIAAPVKRALRRTVRSLVTERDRFREAWQRERREHITTATRGDERIEELEAERDRAVRERDQIEQRCDPAGDTRTIGELRDTVSALERLVLDLEAKLAQRPTITAEAVITAYRHAGGGKGDIAPIAEFVAAELNRRLNLVHNDD